MNATRVTAIELAIASVVAATIGLLVLIIPSSLSAPISAGLAIIGLALAATAYRMSEEPSSARSTSKGGAIVSVIVLADILLGLGTHW